MREKKDIRQEHIELKRREVRDAFSRFGSNSYEYNKSFDELSTLNRMFMAQNYRKERGLPPDSKTPYD